MALLMEATAKARSDLRPVPTAANPMPPREAGSPLAAPSWPSVTGTLVRVIIVAYRPVNGWSDAGSQQTRVLQRLDVGQVSKAV